MKEISIFTDGACSGNPGPAGWGCIILEDKKEIRRYSDGELNSTNNVMELTAALVGLSDILNEYGEGTSAVLYTDSEYVRKGITEWMKGWKRRNWKTANKKSDVKNKDLWVLLDEYNSKLNITWKWVKAHEENVSFEGKWNFEVDRIAYNESQKRKK